jgi:hypothetical protein
MVTVSVGNRYDIDDLRESLSAEWPFLVDSDRSLLHELEMTDTTDFSHGDIYIPYTFILDGDRTIYKVYIWLVVFGSPDGRRNPYGPEGSHAQTAGLDLLTRISPAARAVRAPQANPPAQDNLVTSFVIEGTL